MGNYAANTKLDQLTLVDGPDMASSRGQAPAAPSTGEGPTPADAPAAPELTLKLDTPPPTAAPVAAERAVTPKGSGGVPLAEDPFIAEAQREFEAGHVEQPIWVRALAQHSGNVALAKPAYVRARAVALRLARRTASDGSQRRRSAGEASERRGAAAPPVPGTLDRKRIALAAGGLVAIAVIVGLFVMRPGGTPPSASATAAAALPKAAPAKAVAAEKKPDGAPTAEDFARKIQEFKDAGNWNVLVLYAVEWTRKEPANPEAWRELGGGYLRMRQYDDALEATRKAVQMTPNDAQLWQNLGQINIALRQPAAALAAFDKAIELSERDVTSRVQAGNLNVELGHLSQARADFASALAINPLDTEALCGAATVARKEGRAKDAEAIARQLKSGSMECREPEPPAPPPVAAASPGPAKKPAPPRGR